MPILHKALLRHYGKENQCPVAVTNVQTEQSSATMSASHTASSGKRTRSGKEMSSSTETGGTTTQTEKLLA